MVVYSPLLKLHQSVPLGHRYWFFTKRLTWSHFILSIKDTCTQTTSIFFIVVSASILVGFLALNGMEPSLGGIVEDADVSLWLLMVIDGYDRRSISVTRYVSWSIRHYGACPTDRIKCFCYRQCH